MQMFTVAHSAPIGLVLLAVNHWKLNAQITNLQKILLNFESHMKSNWTVILVKIQLRFGFTLFPLF
jgi:hypothetical protein